MNAREVTIAVAANSVKVPFVLAGELVDAYQVEHTSRDTGASFVTPALDLHRLVHPRSEPAPAEGLKVAEIIDFLEAVGKRLTPDNPYITEALVAGAALQVMSGSLIARCYQAMRYVFEREALEIMVEADVGASALDGWKLLRGMKGRQSFVRACPPRLVHVLAGNAPLVAALTIAIGALTKGVHLIKMPSNDLFSTTAILRTMMDIGPGHPVLKSFSAVYWKGGDTSVEQLIYRPQFFDKLVAWGGEKAVRHAQKYVGPGFEIVSWDPKTSISMIGRETFASEATLLEAVELAAIDVTIMDQDACAASRYQYVEGSAEQVDRYCGMLVDALGVERTYCSARSKPTPPEVRSEVESLRQLEPEYRVWGDFSGAGLVIRSEEPVEFFPDSRTVNVVRVDSLSDAVRFANVATQTVGVYPFARKAELRDRLVNYGIQRVTCLGGSMHPPVGGPHDGSYEMNRLVRWVCDEGPLMQ